MRNTPRHLRIPGRTGRLFLPNEVTEWVLPIHLSLLGLREGYFEKHHADTIGHALDLAVVDILMPGKGERRSIECLHHAGKTLTTIRARLASDGKASVTDGEYKRLQDGVLLADRYFRTWTTTRRHLAEETLKLMKQEVAR